MLRDEPGMGGGGLREGLTNLGAILPCFWRLVRGAISDIVARHTGGYRSAAAGRVHVLGLCHARGRADRRDLG